MHAREGGPRDGVGRGLSAREAGSRAGAGAGPDTCTREEGPVERSELRTGIGARPVLTKRTEELVGDPLTARGLGRLGGSLVGAPKSLGTRFPDQGGSTLCVCWTQSVAGSARGLHTRGDPCPAVLARAAAATRGQSRTAPQLSVLIKC